MATLYDLKLNLNTIGEALQAKAEEIHTKAMDPSADMKEIEALEEEKRNLEKRFEIVKAEVDRLEKEAVAKLNGPKGLAAITDDKQRLVAAKAAFYRAALLKQPIPDEAASLLGVQAGTMIAIPAGGGTGGENLLPINMSNELIHEPFVKNPLRSIMKITNVNGLIVPKVAFTVDSTNFVGDADTAKELSATGDKVTFGRFMTKVFCKVADTVVYGSDTNLVETIENALRSGLAAKEKAVTFVADASAESGCNHMTFYEKSSGSFVLTEVEGADLYEAITNAIADLHENFRENASVVMKYADYVSILKALANSSKDLFSAPPERVLGKPVVFCDSATTPIVGDFRYLHLNYENPVVFDTDKDVKAGDFIFVLTAWFDQWRLLNSAFRLTKVVEEQS
jgi:HK97 family phage major capsid protein